MSNAQSQTVNITLPKALLSQIDALAKRDYTSRSDVIRQTMLQRVRHGLKRPITDEWGEEGDWQTLVDFREIDPHGVPIDEVIAALKELEKDDRQSKKASRKIAA